MVKYTYLGHSCFLLDNGKYKVLTDPFLTGNPLAAMKAEDVKCDFILVSHAHGDHLGDAAQIAKRTGATVVAIPEVLGVIEEQIGTVTSCPMNIGGTANLPFGKVKMVMAVHSSGVAGGIACGFVISIGGKVIYFAGDTSLFCDMKQIGQTEPIDYAALPIGDNYTMGISDAAIAAKWLEAKNVIPIHYNTWPVIAQDAEEYKKLVEKDSKAKVQIVKSGETIELK